MTEDLETGRPGQGETVRSLRKGGLTRAWLGVDKKIKSTSKSTIKRAPIHE